MKSRETILDELKQISPLLAGIDPVNLYSVPYLYFEELEGKVIKAISEENKISGKDLNRVNNSENSTSQDELPGILNDLKPGKSMTVPAGYFDSFASNVLQKIKEEEANAEKQSPETVFKLKPVSRNAKLDELYSESQRPEPVSEEVSKKNPESETGGKVIKMAPRRKVYFQWAAAAVTIGIIALAVFLYNGNRQPANSVAVTSEIEDFSSETLESFVEGQTVDLIPVVASASSDLKAEDMRAVIGDISEEALQLYLNTHNSNLETQVN
jgi:hypothetical protein